jgi:hypothetical protein
MSQQRALLLRNGLVAGCAFAAIVLLASFYSTVSGAVEQAARHRLALVDSAVATQAVLAAPTSAIAARAPRRAALVARADN